MDSQPSTGSALVRITAAAILPYHNAIYTSQRTSSLPKPLIPGFSAIGRIAAVGRDATLLKPGQLVYVDCVVRARDDPSCFFLSAIYEGGSEGSKMLMRDAWRDGTFAEYARVPVENCIVLKEDRLCAGLGYAEQDLAYMAYMLVPYGGLRDIQLQAGETIIVCPATGFYSSLGVQVAVAMGARVVAAGRNAEKMAALKGEIERHMPGAEIEMMTMTGDEDEDAGALRVFGADAVLDMTPSTAGMATHTKSAIKALRRGGRVSLMGSTKNISVAEIMMNDITLKGKMMYEREAVVQFVKMVERGLFPMDCIETKAFSLENWKEGLYMGGKHNGIGKCVVLAP
ncbi:hypothetical protein MW887_002526 [Aspergillus wentii]|nr:hypothetical protein MW887_002526 [Aspergillus wentii]